MKVRVLVVVLCALFLPQLAEAQERELAQASPCDPDQLAALEIEARANGERVYHLGTFGDAPFWDPRKYAMKDGENFVKLMNDARTQEAFRANGMSEADLAEVKTALEEGRFEDVMLECGDPFTFMSSQDWRGMTTITKGRMGFNVKAILVKLSDGRSVGLIRWCGNPILVPASPPAPRATVEFLPAVEVPTLNPFKLRAHVPLQIPCDEEEEVKAAPVVVIEKKRNWKKIVGWVIVGTALGVGINSTFSNPPNRPGKSGGPGVPPS